MGKATKAMKAMKAKKAMKKATSKIGKGKLAKAQVFKGRKVKTQGGLTKSSLVKSKSGKIVAKSRSDRAKRNFAKSALKKWMDACKLRARSFALPVSARWAARLHRARLCMRRSRPLLASRLSTFEF